MANEKTNYTKIKISKSYIQGTTQLDITIENKAKDIYLHAQAWNYETRTTWGHKGTLWGHVGNIETNLDKKIVYLNRTWECYRFQSLIHSMLRSSKVYKGKENKKLIDKLLDRVDAKARKMYI